MHDDFRLFMSSMPSKVFPLSVLQNSMKTTLDPPKGSIRVNLAQSFASQVPVEWFDEAFWLPAFFCPQGKHAGQSPNAMIVD